MIDNSEFLLAIEQLAKEKGMNADELYATIQQALKKALKKKYNLTNDDSIVIEISKETGGIRAFNQRVIVDEVLNLNTQVSLEEAREIDSTLEIGDVVREELDVSSFKRVAAQAAKNHIRQQLRESEKNMIYNEFKEKKDEIITVRVERIEKKNVIVDLGDYEGVLPVTEQIEGEEYLLNQQILVYISDVKLSNKAPQIVLSRTHPGLVKKLFEKEIPEIKEGIVEVKGVIREAGSRTKIAVDSNEEDVDPIGACVGEKGIRVQNIVNELRGEKIDIIRWSIDPCKFISASLSPSKVVSVEVDESTKSAKVVVPGYQLSLAIGKDGQNARLAARLTGWKIDIKPDDTIKQDDDIDFSLEDENN